MSEREALVKLLDDNSVSLHAAEYGTGAFFSMEADELADIILAARHPVEPVTVETQYGHLLDNLGFIPEYRGINYSTHQRTVSYGPVILAIREGEAEQVAKCSHCGDGMPWGEDMHLECNWDTDRATPPDESEGSDE